MSDITSNQMRDYEVSHEELNAQPSQDVQHSKNVPQTEQSISTEHRPPLLVDDNRGESQDPPKNVQTSDSQLHGPPLMHIPGESNLISNIVPSNPPAIKPLLSDDSDTSLPNPSTPVPLNSQQQDNRQQSTTKTIITRVKLTDELNIFDWSKASDIINQIAEKAKSSVDSVITVLDPGMKEYLYSGGNVNIMVIADNGHMISPIRDAFQSIFGRATVFAARQGPSTELNNVQSKIASDFDGSIRLAKERIGQLRTDTSNVPQNQVITVVQPTIVEVVDAQAMQYRTSNPSGSNNNRINSKEPFLTYCMLLEDPVLGLLLSCFSQLFPLDYEVVKRARGAGPLVGGIHGYNISLDELMLTDEARLRSSDRGDESNGNLWLKDISGLDESLVIQHLSLTLANMYRKRLNDCLSSELAQQ